MQLQILKCPACASSVNVDTEKDVFTCEYCKNTINIIKPITVNDFVSGLNEVEQRQYSNYLKILNQSMLAGNFKEAYEYCNKALEINPNSSELWENKAICCLWKSNIENLEENIIEIYTYINASRNITPKSPSHKNTAKAISINLYYCILYKYHLIYLHASNTQVYSYTDGKNILSCLRSLEICYNIYPDVNILKKEVNIIINGIIRWVIKSGKSYKNSIVSNKHNFDAVSKINNLIKIINNDDPNYILSDLSDYNGMNKKVLFYIFLGLIIIMIIALIVSNSKPGH